MTGFFSNCSGFVRDVTVCDIKFLLQIPESNVYCTKCQVLTDNCAVCRTEEGVCSILSAVQCVIEQCIPLQCIQGQFSKVKSVHSSAVVFSAVQ